MVNLVSRFYGSLPCCFKSYLWVCTQTDAFAPTVDGVPKNPVHLHRRLNPQVKSLCLVISMSADLTKPFEANVCHLHGLPFVTTVVTPTTP